MITHDYLIREKEGTEWKYSSDAITAEDAVRDVVKEGVILTGSSMNMCFFLGLNTEKEYIAYRLTKIYMVVSNYYGTHILASFTDKKSAEEYLRKVIDEIGKIIEVIVDDPRELSIPCLDGLNIYYVHFGLCRVRRIFKIGKFKKYISKLNCIKLSSKGNNIYQVLVSAKDEEEAGEKVTDLINKYKRGEEVKCLT